MNFFYLLYYKMNLNKKEKETLMYCVFAFAVGYLMCMYFPIHSKTNGGYVLEGVDNANKNANSNSNSNANANAARRELLRGLAERARGIGDGRALRQYDTAVSTAR